MQPSNSLSSQSLSLLANVHPDLVKVVLEVGKIFPCKVVQGYRGQADQNDAYSKGRSKLRWPESKHNSEPSEAVDLSPIPYEPNDIKRLILFGGFVLGTAYQLKIPIRWGGDFNGNLNPSDDGFKDLFHFELLSKI